MSEQLKFSMSGEEAAAKRKVTRIQILQGNAECFRSKNPTLLSGEFAYERDTGKIKIGDGITKWNDLPYKADQALTSDMVNIINKSAVHMDMKGKPQGYASLDANGKIPRTQLPEDIKSTTVLRTVTEMNNIPASDRYMGQFVFVLDASEDDTVGSGAATYVWTGSKWEKVSEAESLDIDQSVFFLKSKDTLDTILPGDRNVHFTTKDKEKLASIEEGATGDLTSQEIAGMYEGIDGVNRFTNESRKKLEGIEDGATKDTPEKIREKLQTLSGNLRLDADYIKSGDINKFFTEKERKELDNIISKLDSMEDGATSDTPEQIRDKIESLPASQMLNADYIADGSIHKFLTSDHIASIKLIDQLNKEIENIRNKIAEIGDNSAEKEERKKEIADLLAKLEDYKREIGKILNEKFGKIQNDLGNNTVNITNLGNEIEGFKAQLANLKNAVDKGVSQDKIDEILKTIANYKTEISNILNQKFGKIENDLGNNTVNITNLGNEIDGFKAQLANLSNAVAKGVSQDKINEILNTITNYKTEISNILNQRVGKVESDLGNNTVNISNLGNEIEGFKAQLANLKNAVDKGVSQEKIDEILNTIANYKTEINKILNQRVGKVESDLGNNTVNITNLGNEIDGFKAQLANLNNAVAKGVTQDEIADILNMITNYKTEISRILNQRVGKVESDLGNNTVNISNLGNEIEGFKAQLANLKNAVDKGVSQEKIAEIEKSLENYKNEINKILNQKFVKIENDLGNNTVNIQNVEQEIDDIKYKLGKIDIEDIKSGCEEKCKDIVQKIDNYKNEINQKFEDHINKIKLDLGDMSINLKNEFNKVLNQKFESELKKFENIIKNEIDTIKTYLTPKQIKVLYESNPDTNVFTDAEKNKLAGIQPNANPTNYETVKDAGAIMEGDILFGGDCASMF